MKRGTWVVDAKTGTVMLLLKDKEDIGNKNGLPDVVVFNADGSLRTYEEGKIPPSDWEMFDVTEYLEAEIRIMSDRIVRFVAEPESAGGPK